MKKIILFIILLQPFWGFAQKSETRNKAINLGLSYRVYEFYEEDHTVSPAVLTDGKWADGLLGVDIGYMRGFNKLVGLSVDYRFLFGAFQRGFEYYSHAENPPDLASGHQFYLGPTLNLGKGVFNICFKAQLGYDYLHVKGKGDYYKTITATNNINYVGVGDNIHAMWVSMLSNYNKESEETIYRQGYPALKRSSFLYQLGSNINFTWEKTTFTIFANYCPVQFNDITHKEFDIGMGTIFHF